MQPIHVKTSVEHKLTENICLISRNFSTPIATLIEITSRNSLLLD
jgi:hypothetical protein